MYTKSLFYLVSLAVAAVNVEAASGYVNSCTGARIINTGTNGPIVLQASCKRAGGRNEAALDLGQCYINDGGVVRFSKGGGFGASCGPATLQGQSEMHVGCSNGHGGTFQNTVNLNLHIGNSNGNLVC